VSSRSLMVLPDDSARPFSTPSRGFEVAAVKMFVFSTGAGPGRGRRPSRGVKVLVMLNPPAAVRGGERGDPREAHPRRSRGHQRNPSSA